MSEENDSFQNTKISRKEFLRLMGAGSLFIGLSAFGISNTLKTIREASAAKYSDSPLIDEGQFQSPDLKDGSEMKEAPPVLNEGEFLNGSNTTGMEEFQPPDLKDGSEMKEAPPVLNEGEFLNGSNTTGMEEFQPPDLKDGSEIKGAPPIVDEE